MPYPCRFCSAVPQTPASSIRHQRSHAKNNRTFMFYCPLPCDFLTSSFSSLDKHISINHRECRHIDPASTEELFCPADTSNCFFSTTSLVLLVRHLYEHLEVGLHVICPIEECSHLCKTKVALKVHLSSYHSDWAAEGCPKESYKKVPAFEDELPHEDFDENNYMDYEENQAEPETEPCNDSECNDIFNDELIFGSIGKFYLTLYAEKKMAQTTIQFICDSITFMTEVAHARMKKVLNAALEDLEVSKSARGRICNDVLKADLMYAAHHKNSSGPSVTSHYLRKKFFKEFFGFFEPVEFSLDEDDPESGKKLQHVSVKKSLSVVLKDPSFQKEVINSFSPQQRDESIVSDYQDGYLFKSEDHPPKEIQLLLHQDSYNPVPNALGSAKNKYKALVVYFTIGNLRPHLRSKIVTKHLAMMIRESVFKEVGPKKCLEELISELKALEENGIEFMGETIPVNVELMLGDSLGQHLIGGFIESFSGEFMCRFCVVTRKEMKTDPLIIKEARTAQDFDRCALRATLTGEPYKGIKDSCELNKLKYFHASSHLVPCIAHDCFEGAFSWDLSGIIARFVKIKKWFPYKLLNDRIKTFRCVGVDSANKPGQVNTNGKKLGGHAVQNWTMIRLFYFIIGDKIKDFEDDGWLLYLKLKELCEYFCAPSFRKSDIPYLKDVLLPAYFDLRKAVLGHNKKKYGIKPKHHYIAHYPDLLLKYGPLIYVWTLPFEQKHKFFKELMRNTQNYINPEYSCAERQQMYFCYSSLEPMLEDIFEETGTTVLSPNAYTGQLSAFLEGQNLNGWSASKMVVANHGVTYQCNNVLLLGKEGNSLSIGFLKVIASKGNKLNFIVEETTAMFLPAIGCYEVDINTTGTLVILSAASLKYPVPQPVYPKGKRMLISLKHRILEDNNESAGNSSDEW